MRYSAPGFLHKSDLYGLVWVFLSAVADIAKNNFADKNKNIMSQPLIFGLVSKLPIHISLSCVKIPATNFPCLSHFKHNEKTANHFSPLDMLKMLKKAG